MQRLVLEQAQLRAGCMARSWKTSSSAFPHLPEPGPSWKGFRSVLSKAAQPSLLLPWEPVREWQGQVTRSGAGTTWVQPGLCSQLPG